MVGLLIHFVGVVGGIDVMMSHWTFFLRSAMPSESQINCYFCSVALNIASCRGDGMARSFFCKSIARALALFLVCGVWNKTSRSIRLKGFFHSRGWGESNPEMTPLIRNQLLHCSQVEHPYGLCYLPFYSNHGSPWVRSR